MALAETMQSDIGPSLVGETFFRCCHPASGGVVCLQDDDALSIDWHYLVPGEFSAVPMLAYGEPNLFKVAKN
jgi:hypothetical protein